MHEAKQFNIQIEFSTFRWYELNTTSSNPPIGCIYVQVMYTFVSYGHFSSSCSMLCGIQLKCVNNVRFVCFCIWPLHHIECTRIEHTAQRIVSPMWLRIYPLAAACILFIFLFIQLPVHCGWKSFVGKQKEEVFVLSYHHKLSKWKFSVKSIKRA